MISPHVRLVRRRDNKMFHFVIGYTASAGFGPVRWTVLEHNPDTHSSQWRQITLMDDEVEKQHWTGIFDDTTWGMLSTTEMKFWNDKGLNFDTWKGKPVFISDIVKWVSKDKNTEKFQIIRLEHLVCFKDKDACVHEIPFDRDEHKMYVIGNCTQNSELLETVKK